MISFIFKRLLQSIVVMLVVALIAFSMFRYVGDPVNNMVGQDTTDVERAELTEQLGLNDPFIVQYGRFVLNAIQGDFGTSYKYRRPVGELILERLSATLELSFVSAILALGIGIPCGVYTALRRNGLLSKSIMALSLVGVSLPTFLIGILLILLFGVVLRWLPT
ncbi:MAG: ABC transporter permease, partial [Sneathiella sp.]